VEDPHPREGGGHLAERRDEGAVEFDREDVGAGAGDGDRERAEPGADLDDAPTRRRARVRGDRGREVRIDEEALTERSGRDDAVRAGERPDLTQAEGLASATR
jgi:hypothetical protein